MDQELMTTSSVVATTTTTLAVYHERVKTGCFVYQVVRKEKVLLRSCPEMGKEEEEDEAEEEESHFEFNELLAVDLIQPGPHATFLRLADQSGWVMADEGGEVYLRSVPVTTGLYQFYIDHEPQTVRFHPMDESSELLVSEAGAQVLQPMQKIYCDSMVEHPVTKVKFYRLQGFSDSSPATPGWVHDRQGGVLKLLEASHVKAEALWAYRLLKDETVRCHPNCTDDSKTETTVRQGEIVVGDLLRASRLEDDNGPFLRLTDGSGWMYAHCSGFPIMISVPVVTGRWILMVQNEPVGMKLRRQPVDTQDKIYDDKMFEFGELVECDRKIAGDDNINFYRVAGTNGWLFDSRNNKPMMKLLSEEFRVDDEEKLLLSEAWEPDFVRGIAATVPGIQEICFQETSAVLTFTISHKMEVKVFCRTHMACTTFSTFRLFECGTTPAVLREILSRDLAQAVTAYHFKQRKDCKPMNVVQEQQKQDGTPALHTIENPVGDDETEEDLRNRLMTLDLEIGRINARRRELLSTIKVIENKRINEANRMQEESEKFMTAATVKAVPESPKQKLIRVSRTGSNGNPVNNLVISTAPDTHATSSCKNVVPVHDERDSADLDTPREEVDTTTTTKHKVFVVAEPAGFKMSASPPLSPLSACSSSAMTGNNSRRVVHVCSECCQEFSGKYSRDIHCREVHQLFCAVCDQIFLTSQEQQSHMLEVRHE